MIFTLICSPFFAIVEFFISLLPSDMQIPQWGTDFLNLLGVGLSFFPTDVYIFAITTICFWSSVYLIDSICVFILRKIPFLGVE